VKGVQGIPARRPQIRLVSRTTAAALATATAIAVLVISQLPTATAGSSIRCCLKVTANVLGTISLEFPQNPRMAWQGRRDYSWSARETGLYELEDLGGAEWLFYELHPRTKIKGGASEIGTLTYNFRSPDPPDPNREDEPEISNCGQFMSTGQKWKWSGPREPAGEAGLIDREAGGDELRITVNERLTQMDHDDVAPFTKSGECDHELVDHHGDTGGNDGLPITDYPEIPTPALLRGRNLPSHEKLRKASPFQSKKKEYRGGGHQPTGPIESSTHHTTVGSVKVKWVRFEYFPKKRLKEEIEALKKLD
jgi:hypothetical protein